MCLLLSLWRFFMGFYFLQILACSKHPWRGRGEPLRPTGKEECTSNCSKRSPGCCLPGKLSCRVLYRSKAVIPLESSPSRLCSERLQWLVTFGLVGPSVWSGECFTGLGGAGLQSFPWGAFFWALCSWGLQSFPLHLIEGKLKVAAQWLQCTCAGVMLSFKWPEPANPEGSPG